MAYIISMSLNVKRIDPKDLGTIIESEELVEFKKKKDFFLKNRKDAENAGLGHRIGDFLKAEFKRDLLGSLLRIGNVDVDEDRVYYREKDNHLDVCLKPVNFGDREVQPQLKIILNPKFDNMMKVMSRIYDQYSHSQVITDALLLSYPDKPSGRQHKKLSDSIEVFKDDDICVKRVNDGSKYKQLYVAPLTRFGEILKEAENIYKKIGEEKLEELRKMRPIFQNIENFESPEDIVIKCKQGEYIVSLLDAMGMGVKYL